MRAFGDEERDTMGPWIVGRNRRRWDIGWFWSAGTGGTAKWKAHGSFCRSLDA